jgi:hypothetical protein
MKFDHPPQAESLQNILKSRVCQGLKTAKSITLADMSIPIQVVKFFKNLDQSAGVRVLVHNYKTESIDKRRYRDDREIQDRFYWRG